MPKTNLHQKLSHSFIFIFLLGGVLGSIINFIVTISFYFIFQLNPFFSFFIGIIFNELFNHTYYHILFTNREIRMKTPLNIQLFLYLCVAFASLFILWFFFLYLKMEFISSVLLSIIILSSLSAFFIKISAFSSAELAHVEYTEIKESYYKELTDSQKVSNFRSWYHSSRFQKLANLVEQNYQPNMKIADLGCGNCLWNKKHIPVTGVDINEKMLQWANKGKYLSNYILTDNLAKTGLPSKSFDMVIMSETLEHLLNLEDVLAEVHRIIKDDGIFLITVPYDFFLGPFFILFNLNCLYTGFIKGSRYHQFRCGHINHFTITRLRKALEENKFKLTSLSIVNCLLLYTTAKKVIN
jgi:2-polyprenyl-3-methyl-5-hydroxy-6-metoxy-1,4-benzoquinol methylase